MLRTSPRAEPPRNCQECEFSTEINGPHTEHLVACIKYNTHVFYHQCACVWRQDATGPELARSIKLRSEPWLTAIRKQKEGDYRPLEMIVNEILLTSDSDLSKVPLDLVDICNGGE